MGLYDIFVDGKKEVQLKNFDCAMAVYKTGNKTPVKHFNYPKSGIFFCWANPDYAVVIKNERFKEIIKLEEAIEKYKNFRIWNCHGEEFFRQDMI